MEMRKAREKPQEEIQAGPLMGTHILSPHLGPVICSFSIWITFLCSSGHLVNLDHLEIVSPANSRYRPDVLNPNFKFLGVNMIG